jgi:hypothetical protein
MDVFNAGLGNDDIIINASISTHNQIIQAITVDIACTGDCVTTTITCHFTIVINGEAAGDASGCSVSSAGDVNGDGLDDLIVGAYQANPNGKLSAVRPAPSNLRVSTPPPPSTRARLPALVCSNAVINTVNALGFVKTASTETENGITYDVYTHSDANTDAKAALWVQQAA